MIYRLLIIPFLFSSFLLKAQDAGAANENAFELKNFMDQVLLFTGLIVVLVAFAVILYLFNILVKIQERQMLEAQGIKVAEPVAKPTTVPLWKKWYRQFAGWTPLEKEKDLLMDHDYDGIRELDNSLPPWWVAMFYITILFAVVYIGYFHLSDRGYGQIEEYEWAMEEAEEAKIAFLAKQANLVDETNVEMNSDEAFLAAGEAIFKANCVACHGPNGEGNTIGPNMTDQYWIHGGGIKNVFKTIKYGVVEKGMQSWKAMLNPTAMHQVASYIMTLQGTNPPNAKEPQGELWEGEEETKEDETIGMK